MAKKQKVELRTFDVPVVRYGYATGTIKVVASSQAAARRQLDGELSRDKYGIDDIAWSEFYPDGSIEVDAAGEDEEQF